MPFCGIIEIECTGPFHTNGRVNSYLPPGKCNVCKKAKEAAKQVTKDLGGVTTDISVDPNLVLKCRSGVVSVSGGRVNIATD